MIFATHKPALFGHDVSSTSPLQSSKYPVGHIKAMETIERDWENWDRVNNNGVSMYDVMFCKLYDMSKLFFEF